MKSYSPPPDKSITIRALLLAAAAEGSTRIENPLDCGDTRDALRCLEALGVRLCREGGAIIVEGRGLRGFARPAGPLDAGESGALARLLAGLLAAQPFPSSVTGRGTLLKRPMAPVAEALRRIGAKVTAARGRLPLTIKPARPGGGRVAGVSSAQVKSAVLLAGLSAAGPVEVLEKFPTRDHTERLLALMGARLVTGRKIRLEPGPLTARPVAVPGDVSAAAPFFAAALLSKTALEVAGCGLNPSRLGLLRALGRMGARLEFKPGAAFPEPSGAVLARPGPLRAARFSAAEIPSMIDEVPLLAVLAGRAKGVTVIAGVEALRGKESDRVESTLALLRSLGVKAAYSRGALRVTGAARLLAAAPVETFSDHRIAMAAAAAAAACPGLRIQDPGCVDKSYPGFWSDFGKVFGIRPA